ncbi:hypothetical protein EUTSA_v10000428mg [Eutrema salsugineum]|uniref:Uncharacterized protein n=1 Tax=Eutrema salsugineum TaxID=72664 RepID=V4L7F6_EUTSA|nr:hypothetical protein EUTSA_v10000428mg [Eutrema salsugineum]
MFVCFPFISFSSKVKDTCKNDFKFLRKRSILDCNLDSLHDKINVSMCNESFCFLFYSMFRFVAYRKYSPISFNDVISVYYFGRNMLA